MGAAAVPLMVAGTVMNAYGQYQSGQDAKSAANYQANQLNVNAGQAKAASQVQAGLEARNTQLMVSRARAVAAASGGSADDPTVANIMARIAGEGSFRQRTALYGGESQARQMNMQADALRYQGQQAAQAGKINAVSSLLKGGAQAYSMNTKYGGGLNGGTNGAGSMDGSGSVQGNSDYVYDL
jgi:hypothetical protein